MLLIAATTNKGKQKELHRILEPYGVSVVSMLNAGIDIEIVENGTTFEENALIKARTIHQITGKAVIADDSGLCVNCLNGNPGVYSARYGGENADYKTKINLLLDEINESKSTDRSAYFKTAIALITSDSIEYVFEGICEGYIGNEPKGENGFGYDPVFYIDGKSFGEISDAEKDKLSHRGKAMAALLKELPKIVNK